MTRTNKPVYTYTFNSVEASKQFYLYARQHSDSTNVLHPQTNAIPDQLKVLVIGTGSLNFDLLLKQNLDQVFSQLTK